MSQPAPFETSTERLLAVAEEANARIEVLTDKYTEARGRQLTIGMVILIEIAITVTFLLYIESSNTPLAPFNSRTWLAVVAALASVLVAQAALLLHRQSSRLTRLGRERRTERRALVRIVSILREVRSGMTFAGVSTLDLAAFDIRLARLGIDPADDYSFGEGERISRQLLEKVSPDGSRAESWLRVDRAVRYLADRVAEEFPPDFVVGVYPEGAFVGYLLWLDSQRNWPFIMAPDADSTPLPEQLESMAAQIRAICSGRSELRCLVVDASVKTGQTMLRTLEFVRTACSLAGVDNPHIRTLCLSVRAGYRDRVGPLPDYVGLGSGAELPFQASSPSA